MKFCNNTNFTLPKHSQRSRSALQDGSRSLGWFWKEKTPSYNRRNTVYQDDRGVCAMKCHLHVGLGRISPPAGLEPA